ncbi:hypothetical protein, conserved [Eimeria acervulina]|uniref:Transmembrane protein n=1 Tax=Eimeria acervulina TaxID=5801 RepID=U6GWX4_EIMAC|nr:hypothetical protein, conserved [Eimeria acervulina]CDI83029.1 hypothetical protein, conserved [Eimeria acervulina]
MGPGRTDRRHFFEEGVLEEHTPASAFHTPGEAEDPGNPVGASFEDYLRLKPVGKLRRTPHHRRLVTVALISIVSLMAVASLIALCYTHHNRTNTAGLVKRSLSDLGDEEELSVILEQCVELEEELGFSGTALFTSEQGVDVSLIYNSAANFEEARAIQHQMVTWDESLHLHGLGSFVESLSQETDWSGSAPHMADGSSGGPHWNRSSGGAVSSVGAQSAPYSATGEFPSAFPPLPQQQAPGAVLHQLPTDGKTNMHLDAFDPNAWLDTIPWSLPVTNEHQELQVGPMGVALSRGDASDSQAHIQDLSGPKAASTLSGFLPATSMSQGLAGSPVGGTYGPWTLRGAQEKRCQACRSSDSEQANTTARGHQPVLPASMLRGANTERFQESHMSGPVVLLQTAPHPHPAAGADSFSEARVSGEQNGILRGGEEAEAIFDLVAATTQQESKREGEQPAQGAEVLWGSQESSSSARAVAPTSALCGEAEEMNQLTHPFVRLPLVSPNDIPRSFRTEIAFSTNVFERSSLRILLQMRRLLAKQSLNSWEVEALLRQCEYLVNHAVHKMTAPLSKQGAFFVARRLGTLLFMFDYVVCTIMLLQEKMETEKWWDMFVSKFKTDYYFPDSYVGKRDLERRLPDLVNRLAEALAMYKKGLRPAVVDVIALKKDILELLGNYGYFEHKMWDLWRKDDSRFCRRGAENRENKSI